MVMTPLHMEHGGAELRVIGIVISVHVLGMFAFSPLVGMLADRVGRPPVLAAGGAILLRRPCSCARWAPEGSSWQIFAGLFLLGLGWSFATVAASTMIADHAPLDARTDVQGAADLVMGLTAAAAGGAGRAWSSALAATPRSRCCDRPGAWLVAARGAAVRGAARVATVTHDAPSVADVAVIGGTGFYSFLDDPERAPRRDAVRRPVGAGRGRHGRRPARWRSCPGTAATTSTRRTRSTTAPTSGRCARSASARCSRRARSAACGHEVAPGDVVVPDQLVDRTHRPRPVVRRDRRRATCRSPTPTAPPVAPRSRPPTGRQGRRDDGRDRGPAVLDPGRVAALRRPGLVADQHDRHPEAVLAREMRQCYAAIALVTDMDAGVEAGAGSARRRCSRCSRRTSSGCAGCSPTPSPPCPTRTAARARPGPTASS